MSLMSPERATTSVSDSHHSSFKSAFGRLCRKLSPRRKAPETVVAEEKGLILAASDEEQLAAPQTHHSDDLQRVFSYIDENGDGRISPSELQSCVSLVGGEELTLSQEEAEMAVRYSDSDGDGMLGFEDFAKLMEATESEGERDKEIREAFGMYTTEGTGCITPVSLKRMLSRLGKPATLDSCWAMIRSYDLNGDGVLNFDEFSMMMR